MTTVSDQTRRYWLDTVLGWAEVRLAPPQFDECKAALAADSMSLAVLQTKWKRQEEERWATMAERAGDRQLQELYRNHPERPWDENEAVLAILQALNAEGVYAWDGDGTRIVAQMIGAQHRRATVAEQEAAAFRAVAAEHVSFNLVVARGTCSFCGWDYGPSVLLDKDTISAHVATCTNHPMRALEAERDGLAASLAELLALAPAVKDAAAQVGLIIQNRDELAKALYDEARLVATAALTQMEIDCKAVCSYCHAGQPELACIEGIWFHRYPAGGVVGCKAHAIREQASRRLPNPDNK